MRCEAAAVIVSSDNTALQSQRRRSRLTAHSSVVRAALPTAAEDYSVIDGVSSHLHDEERVLLLLVPPVAFLQKIWALSMSTEEAVASLSNIESARASCAANIRLHLDEFQKTNGRAAVGAVRACSVQLCISYSPAKKSESIEMQSFFASACCLYLSILLTSVFYFCLQTTTAEKAFIKPLYKSYSTISSDLHSRQLQLESVKDSRRKAVETLVHWCVDVMNRHSTRVSADKSLATTFVLSIEKEYCTFTGDHIQSAEDASLKAESDYQHACSQQNALRQEIRHWSVNFRKENGREPVSVVPIYIYWEFFYSYAINFLHQ